MDPKGLVASRLIVLKIRASIEAYCFRWVTAMLHKTLLLLLFLRISHVRTIYSFHLTCKSRRLPVGSHRGHGTQATFLNRVSLQILALIPAGKCGSHSS